MIKIFVSTKKTQGEREGDFSFVPEGEILVFSWECSTPERRKACGCDRSLSGIYCGKSCTTATPALLDLTEADLASLIWDSFRRSGFIGLQEGHPLRRVRLDANKMAQELIVAAMPFEIGDIIERQDLKLRKRAA